MTAKAAWPTNNPKTADATGIPTPPTKTPRRWSCARCSVQRKMPTFGSNSATLEVYAAGVTVEPAAEGTGTLAVEQAK
jgi:hypothetical protein